MGSSISSKKRTDEFNFTTMIIQVDLFSFIFSRKSTNPKNLFEFNWPLSSDKKSTLTTSINSTNKLFAILTNSFFIYEICLNLLGLTNNNLKHCAISGLCLTFKKKKNFKDFCSNLYEEHQLYIQHTSGKQSIIMAPINKVISMPPYL